MIPDRFLTLAIAVMISFSVFRAVLLLSVVSSKYLARQRVSLRLRAFSQMTPTEDLAQLTGWRVPIGNWLTTKVGTSFSAMVIRSRLSATPITVAGNMLITIFSAFLLTLMLIGSLISAVIIALGIFLIVIIWLKQRRIRYEQRFAVQLPQSLSLMANALSSGASLVQAIEHAVRESQAPVKNELLKVLDYIRLGRNLDEALDQLHDELPMPELELVISTLVIQRRVGGNIAKLLNKTSELLREKSELKNELIVQTAQGRLSGKIIGLLPVFIIVILLLIDREFIAPLFNTGLGLVIFFMAALAEIFGFLLIRRILAIDI